MVDTIIKALHKAAGVDNRGITFLNHRLEPDYLSWSQVVIESKRYGQFLLARGLLSGDRLAIMLPNERDFILSFYGAILVGIIPVPVYSYVSTEGLDGYLQRNQKILHSCEARAVLAPQSLLSIIAPRFSHIPTIEQLIAVETVTQDSEREEPDVQFPASVVEPTDLCFLQFTSGSTADPKGVMVSHHNLIANIGAIVETLGLLAEKDVLVCWLPLFHDMGLIGFVLLSAVLHIKVIFMSPITFAARPQSWLETISKYRSTVTASPNFGLGLATKCAGRLQDVDLSCVESIVCGAEPIHPDTVRGFLHVLKPLGLAPTTIVPAYGMAEATLCMTLRKAQKPFHSICIDRNAYEDLEVKKVSDDRDRLTTREVVSCGRVIPGHQLGIVDDKGERLPPGKVGEVVFKGKSVTAGYYADPKLNSALFDKKWLKTGDLGFILDGELFISGRKKDMIIIAGRNIHPQMIEWYVERIPGIRTGKVVAFSLSSSDTERLIIVAESREDSDIDTLKRTVMDAVNKGFALDPYDVVIVAPQTIPKTSSGKLQRSRTEAAYLSGSFNNI